MQAQDIANLAMAIYGPQSELSLISPENITMCNDVDRICPPPRPRPASRQEPFL